MRKLLAAVSILLLLVSPAIAATSDRAEDIAMAQQSAQAWLQLLDAGRYGGSWTEKDEVARAFTGKLEMDATGSRFEPAWKAVFVGR